MDKKLEINLTKWIKILEINLIKWTYLTGGFVTKIHMNGHIRHYVVVATGH